MQVTIFTFFPFHQQERNAELNKTKQGKKLHQKLIQANRRRTTEHTIPASPVSISSTLLRKSSGVRGTL